MMSSSPVWIFDHIKAFDFGLKGISSRLVLKQSVLEQSIAPTCTQRLVKNFFSLFSPSLVKSNLLAKMCKVSKCY